MLIVYFYIVRNIRGADQGCPRAIRIATQQGQLPRKGRGGRSADALPGIFPDPGYCVGLLRSQFVLELHPFEYLSRNFTSNIMAREGGIVSPCHILVPGPVTQCVRVLVLDFFLVHISAVAQATQRRMCRGGDDGLLALNIDNNVGETHIQNCVRITRNRCCQQKYFCIETGQVSKTPENVCRQCLVRQWLACCRSEIGRQRIPKILNFPFSPA